MSTSNEKDFAHIGGPLCSFRADELQASKAFRAEYGNRPDVVHAEDMPMEHSADGLIKHLIHEKMGTKECCVEAYMLFLEAGKRSGKARHMWEEVIFVAEGSGYDLHWDLEFDCQDEFKWSWKEEPKKFTWERGDFIYIPPFTLHQHFNDVAGETRLIVISNRIVREMGFNWFDQIESAPEV